jgi:hypothetical protein
MVWMPKLLTKEQKQEGVQTCQEFAAAMQHHSILMMDNIWTMDEVIVSYHTPRYIAVKTVDLKGETRPHQGSHPG